jgi:hypothetical protein
MRATGIAGKAGLALVLVLGTGAREKRAVSPPVARVRSVALVDVKHGDGVTDHQADTLEELLLGVPEDGTLQDHRPIGHRCRALAGSQAAGAGV